MKMMKILSNSYNRNQLVFIQYLILDDFSDMEQEDDEEQNEK